MSSRSEPQLDDVQASQALESEPQPVCPVCASGSRRLVHAGLRDTLFGAPGTWSVHACAACGALFLDPRPTRAAIGAAYRNYYTHRMSTSSAALDGSSPRRVAKSIKQRLKNGYLVRRYGVEIEPAWRMAGRIVPYLFPRHRVAFDTAVRHLSLPRLGARLLDVGCGSGDFLVAAQALGWNASGLEADPVSSACARARGLRVIEAPIESAGLDSASFDAVTMNHVLEHLHDPVGALSEIWRLLKPGGRLWVATPNADSPLRRRCGERWRGLEPPRHLVIFGRAALELALRRAGFVQLEWLRSYPIARWMLMESGFPDGLSDYEVRAYEIASLLSPRFSEQLVVLARKP